MNDKEDTVKALECCSNENTVCVGHCPFHNNNHDIDVCTSMLARNALDLINRQKAEIERLQELEDNAIKQSKGKINCYNCPLCKIAKRDIEQAKSETIKEFAERLKKEVAHIPAWGRVAEKKIDNLVKEMTENDFKE